MDDGARDSVPATQSPARAAGNAVSAGKRRSVALVLDMLVAVALSDALALEALEGAYIPAPPWVAALALVAKGNHLNTLRGAL
jgi:hypothetical protein